MYDIRIQHHDFGVMNSNALSFTEALKYLRAVTDEHTLDLRALLTAARKHGAVNSTTRAGTDIGIEHY